MDADPDFERLAPVPFSVVCFRAQPRGRDWTEAELEALNQRLLDAMNATGEVFLSHTKLDGRFVLRLAVGNLRTEERHVRRAWEIAKDAAQKGAGGTVTGTAGAGVHGVHGVQGCKGARGARVHGVQRGARVHGVQRGARVQGCTGCNGVQGCRGARGAAGAAGCTGAGEQSAESVNAS